MVLLNTPVPQRKFTYQLAEILLHKILIFLKIVTPAS